MVEYSMSEGARLLVAAGSIEATAKVLGVSERSISAYRAGRRPSEGVQEKMRALLHINPVSWTQRAGSPALAKAAHALREAPAAADAPGAPGAAVGQPEALMGNENAVQRLREQCTRLKVARTVGNLTPRALVELEQLELRCSTQLARLTTHALSEAQIMASRQWQELAQRITDKLAARDLIGFNIFWSACDPESTEPAEALKDMRRSHPAEVAACEHANETLCSALAAALRRREAELNVPQFPVQQVAQ